MFTDLFSEQCWLGCSLYSVKSDVQMSGNAMLCLPYSVMQIPILYSYCLLCHSLWHVTTSLLVCHGLCYAMASVISWPLACHDLCYAMASVMPCTLACHGLFYAIPSGMSRPLLCHGLWHVTTSVMLWPLLCHGLCYAIPQQSAIEILV